MHRLVGLLIALLALSPCDSPPSIEASPLTPNPFAGLCVAACGVDPDLGPPSNPGPRNPCPAGICRRTLVIGPERGLQLEIQGTIVTTSVSLERWTGPIAFQVYTPYAEVYRCTAEVVATSVGFTASAATKGVFARELPSRRALPCELVSKSRAFLVGPEVEMGAALDAALDRARSALGSVRFARDRDVSVWLHQKHAIPPGTQLARTSSLGRASSGTAVVFSPVDLNGLPLVTVDGEEYCSSTWCTGSSSFVGPLRVSAELGFTGAGAERVCAAWSRARGKRMVWWQRGRLVGLTETSGPCQTTVKYQLDQERVPFTAPPIPNPIPPPDPALPSRVDRPWMLPERIQPSALSVPTGADRDLETLASYFALMESDPFLEIKAIHDWIATHISYDSEAYATKTYPPQDAEAVFRSRKAVCAGIANLFVAMGTKAGLDVVWIPGTSRRSDGVVDGHAWNAARVRGRWYLVDVTWDLKSPALGPPDQRISTEWLFTPPEVFRTSHHPNDPRWQLLAPESQAEFLARPTLGYGYVLLDLTSDSISVDGDALSFRLAAPSGRPSARWWNIDSGQEGSCRSAGYPLVGTECRLNGPGNYVVDIERTDGRENPQLVGQLSVERRGAGAYPPRPPTPH